LENLVMFNRTFQGKVVWPGFKGAWLACWRVHGFAQHLDAAKVGDLAGADRIMNKVVFTGAGPGFSPAILDHMVETITKFVRSK
jgi:hypothetical protein